MTNFEMVKKFMKIFGQKVKEKAEFPEKEISSLRYELIKEELEEFKEAFDKSVEGTVGDIQFDHEAINNIPQEFLDKLQAVGPGVAQMFTKMVQDSATGKITSEADAVQRQRDFIKLIKKQLPKLSGNSEILQWANTVIAGATIVPDSFTMKAKLKLIK